MICETAWISETAIGDDGTIYQAIYNFSKNGTNVRTSIAIDKNGIEQQSDYKGQWSFTDKSFGTIYFGYLHYWEIVELTEKKFAFYDRWGEYEDTQW